MSKVLKNLPLLILSGAKGGRHEMLNEINRDEVTGDILSWLNSKGVSLCQNI